MELKDKKSGLKNITPGDLDFESLHLCRLDRSEAMKDQKLRLKFILPEVLFSDLRVQK